MNRRLDTDQSVFFYENDFYVLSNFSAFQVAWEGRTYQTSEHCYQSLKFDYQAKTFEKRLAVRAIYQSVFLAPSAHEAFKIAEANTAFRRPGWEDIRVLLMKSILRAKAIQHDYVYTKLLDTGNRELIEDSWRDDFWGWGSTCNGQNMLGKLWMEIRAELREKENSK